jgi:hypothetical protein
MPLPLFLLLTLFLLFLLSFPWESAVALNVASAFQPAIPPLDPRCSLDAAKERGKTSLF